jgi:diguanylate cyclase (GGDEF)-like protein
MQAGAGELTVTISVGAVTCDEALATDTLEGILTHADVALYQAKANGRNQVVLASQLIAA